MEYFSVKEVAELLGVSERSIQRRCKKRNVRKKDNNYIIDTNLINAWKEEIEKANDTINDTTPTRRDTFANATQLDIEVEVLKKEIEALKDELSQYEIAENERIEVFTNDEYQMFEKRLIEWRTQQLEIAQKDKILELTTKSKDEIITFYQNQLDYQRQLAEKQLQQLETIFEILQGQNKTIHQLNFINAKDKGFDKPK